MAAKAPSSERALAEPRRVDERMVAWERMRSELLSIGAGDPEDPGVEPGVLELVTALRLLGLPTVGSCEGHLIDDRDELPTPYVGIGKLLPRRFLAGDDEDSLYFHTERCSPRERAYLAALGWHRYRPIGWQLRELLDGFYAEQGTPAGERRLRVRAAWWGCAIEMADLADLDSYAELADRDPDAAGELNLRCREQLIALGDYLKRRWHEGTL